MPEILRVKGNILLSGSAVALTTGLSQYARALELAETQSSLSWALRAATANLLAQPDDAAARATLADIHERSTEGFDMPDLALARRLLEGSR
jgi:hypothetical protein